MILVIFSEFITKLSLKNDKMLGTSVYNNNIYSFWQIVKNKDFNFYVKRRQIKKKKICKHVIVQILH